MNTYTMKALVLLPLFLVLISSIELQAQELTMFPNFLGMKYFEDDQEITKQEFTMLLSQNQESQRLWKKSRKHLTVAWVAVAVQYGTILWHIERSARSRSRTLPLIGFIATTGVGIGFSLSANKLRRNAILRYNSQFDHSSVRLGLTEHGVGLSLNF